MRPGRAQPRQAIDQDIPTGSRPPPRLASNTVADACHAPAMIGTVLEDTHRCSAKIAVARRGLASFLDTGSECHFVIGTSAPLGSCFNISWSIVLGAFHLPRLIFGPGSKLSFLFYVSGRYPLLPFLVAVLRQHKAPNHGVGLVMLASVIQTLVRKRSLCRSTYCNFVIFSAIVSWPPIIPEFVLNIRAAHNSYPLDHFLTALSRLDRQAKANSRSLFRKALFSYSATSSPDRMATDPII